MFTFTRFHGLAALPVVQSHFRRPALHSPVSLFERAGRKYEAVKQSFVSGRDAAYVCRDCEEPVAADHEYCPHCGEPAVEPVE